MLAPMAQFSQRPIIFSKTWGSEHGLGVVSGRIVLECATETGQLMTPIRLQKRPQLHFYLYLRLKQLLRRKVGQLQAPPPPPSPTHLFGHPASNAQLESGTALRDDTLPVKLARAVAVGTVWAERNQVRHSRIHKASTVLEFTDV